ncbi:MAG: PHP domain-containing protein [Cytophagaceae bacterium]|jgi:DNA polymerase (family 10)|nr:PHP domain-containing protein [Cytophagaceae bacterium]
MGLTNGRIIDVLEQTVLLLELHEENQFKIRGLQNAIFHLEKQSVLLHSLSLSELESLEGIGKGIASKIVEINTTGTTAELQHLLSQTPAGVVDILSVKGIGPKKVRTLWKEAQLLSLEMLYDACLVGKVSALKGFGEKTQESIRQSIEFLMEQKGKHLISDAEFFSSEIKSLLESLLEHPVYEVGAVRRRMEVAETLSFVSTFPAAKGWSRLEASPLLITQRELGGPYAWRGKHASLPCSVELLFTDQEHLGNILYLHSSAVQHLRLPVNEHQNVLQFLSANAFESEEKIAEALSMKLIPSEYREGGSELEEARKNELPAFLEYSDLRGAWHNHSVWSDGKNTLREMAEACMAQGWQHFGISDHSQTAIYANGLQEFRIKQQHAEIDALNKELAPFKIFKGIESDILQDGSLDYPEAVLASFDFIVASVHSGLSMTEEKATERLLKAIENPYTTMLGHSCGRLLLKRPGYPLDYKKIIDACAAHEVIIEINANPWRLDMDWRWLRYALSKGVIISINPDAHEIAGLDDMKYGVYVGRKAGLSAAQTFNAWPLEKIESWLAARKDRKASALTM